MPRLIAYLGVRDAAAAVQFYQKAFGAEEIGPRITDPAGKIGHTELRLGDDLLFLADENPEFGNHSPVSLGGTPVRLNLEVDDVDAVVQTATEAGAKILIPVADQFYGYRAGRIEDPFGHQWIVNTKVEDLTNEEIQRRAAELFGGAE